jgi:hypothetical protein
MSDAELLFSKIMDDHNLETLNDLFEHLKTSSVKPTTNYRILDEIGNTLDRFCLNKRFQIVSSKIKWWILITETEIIYESATSEEEFPSALFAWRFNKLFTTPVSFVCLPRISIQTKIPWKTPFDGFTVSQDSLIELKMAELPMTSKLLLELGTHYKKYSTEDPLMMKNLSHHEFRSLTTWLLGN